MEGMELGHETQDLEVSIDTSPSDGLTAISMMNEHSTSIDTTNMGYSSTQSNGVRLQAAGVKNNDEGKAPTLSRQTETRNCRAHQRTMDEYYIGKINGVALITRPKTSSGTRNPEDYYITPDNNPPKKESCWPIARQPKSFGAKTATSRALDFREEALNKDEEVSKKSISAAAKTVSTSRQSEILFPFRKRKAIPTGPSVVKLQNCSGGENCVTTVNIEKNEGNVFVGNNLNIIIRVNEAKSKPGEAEEVEADGSFPSISPEKSLKVKADETFEAFMIEFQDIINCLHPLRDKGRHKEFYSVAERIAAAGSSKPHIQILVLIEKSMTLSYQKEFANSKKVIDEAIMMISSLGVKMKNFLLTYSHVHKIALSRRQDDISEAMSLVSIAMQSQEFVPFGITRVFLEYEQASNLTKMLSLMNVDEEEPSWKILKKKAKKSLKECISLAQRIHEERSSIYLQRQHFSLVKMALMNLNCRTKASRTQPVMEESIHEADSCLNKMEESEGDMSEALSIQFYTGKCDLYFRRKEFYRAKSYAQQALSIATDNNISLEIKSIQERLKDINQLLTEDER